MFLKLAHTKLDVYTITRQFVKESYVAVAQFPADEKFILSQQIKKAALSVHLNLAEGSSRKSDPERERFYQIARGSIIEVDAALDIALDLGYCSIESINPLGNVLVKCFKYISALINSIPIN